MKMASRSIHLISKQTKIARAAQSFFLSRKKPNLHLHAFLSFFAVVLQDYNVVLYDQNVKLPSYRLFLWRNYSRVHVRFYFFHCRLFSPCWPLLALLAASLSHFLRISPI